MCSLVTKLLINMKLHHTKHKVEVRRESVLCRRTLQLELSPRTMKVL